MENNSQEKVRQFKKLLDTRNSILGFTGAGISTESGISDYRSQGGIWDRFQPVYFDEFLHDAEKRMLYWQRKVEMWPQIADAQPNRGHLFFGELHEQGKLLGLITQNIDGLHEKGGVPMEKIITLHGNAREIRCLSCGNITSAEPLFAGLDLEQDGPPVCALCGGLLKPDTISFGQNLNQSDLDRAYELSRECDFMIALGSTLVVQPAARFPAVAQKNGAALAIVTLTDTPLDDIADLVIHMKIGEFLKKLESTQ